MCMCVFIHLRLHLFWQVWNQEETEDGKEEGERREEKEARRRTGKKEAISGSRHTSGESQSYKVTPPLDSVRERNKNPGAQFDLYDLNFG